MLSYLGKTSEPLIRPLVFINLMYDLQTDTTFAAPEKCTDWAVTEKEKLLLLLHMSSTAVVLDVIKPHVNFHALLKVKRG